MGFDIYTDGSHKGRWGAWAFVVVRNGKTVCESYGRERKTGSNRMEFRAAIEALKSLPPNSRATVFSDSRLLIDSLTLWIPDWRRLGWIKPNGRSIPNVDLLQELDILNARHDISWRWIKAHSGIAANERCDALCVIARSPSS